MRLANPIDLAGAAVAVAVLAVLPLFFPLELRRSACSPSALCYGIWAASWDFMSGLTGRENFGHSLFIGAGAYTAGFLNTEFGVNAWWSLARSAGGGRALRSRRRLSDPALAGPYFALAMLSADDGDAAPDAHLLAHTGGEDGLNGLAPLIHSQLGFYYFTLAFLAASAVLLRLIANSSWGVILRAIRGEELPPGQNGRNSVLP